VVTPSRKAREKGSTPTTFLLTMPTRDILRRAAEGWPPASKNNYQRTTTANALPGGFEARRVKRASIRDILASGCVAVCDGDHGSL
jgi:hypothetical protein